jgi:MFS transporter, DHA1 family, multidrug resistance protein
MNLTTVSNLLQDMYEQRERGTAVVVYSLALVGGPTLGPVIGSAISQSHLGWRWTEVSLLICLHYVCQPLIMPGAYSTLQSS